MENNIKQFILIFTFLTIPMHAVTGHVDTRSKSLHSRRTGNGEPIAKITVPPLSFSDTDTSSGEDTEAESLDSENEVVRTYKQKPDSRITANNLYLSGYVVMYNLLLQQYPETTLTLKEFVGCLQRTLKMPSPTTLDNQKTQLTESQMWTIFRSTAVHATHSAVTRTPKIPCLTNTLILGSGESRRGTLNPCSPFVQEARDDLIVAGTLFSMGHPIYVILTTDTGNWILLTIQKDEVSEVTYNVKIFDPTCKQAVLKVSEEEEEIASSIITYLMMIESKLPVLNELATDQFSKKTSRRGRKGKKQASKTSC